MTSALFIPLHVSVDDESSVIQLINVYDIIRFIPIPRHEDESSSFLVQYRSHNKNVNTQVQLASKETCGVTETVDEIAIILKKSGVLCNME